MENDEKTKQDILQEEVEQNNNVWIGRGELTHINQQKLYNIVTLGK